MTEPTWATRGARRLVWEEDDAMTWDREKIEGAWQRLFGERLDIRSAAAKYDAGDAVFYLFPGGRIACSACDGEAIYQCHPSLVPTRSTPNACVGSGEKP